MHVSFFMHAGGGSGETDMMEWGTMIGLGLGLSMDAVAVTITNTLVYQPLDRRKQIAMPLFFGVLDVYKRQARSAACGSGIRRPLRQQADRRVDSPLRRTV